MIDSNEYFVLVNEKFPHIGRKIEVFWGQPECHALFRDLMLDTVIFNEKPGVTSLTECVRSSPEKGKLIVFDSYYLHSSSPPKHHDARLVINILFRK